MLTIKQRTPTKQRRAERTTRVGCKMICPSWEHYKDTVWGVESILARNCPVLVAPFGKTVT